MNIKYECNNKVENISIINYISYKSEVCNKKVTEILKNIMDIRDIITTVYGIDNLQIVVDKLEYRIKMEVVIRYMDEDYNECGFDILFNGDSIYVDVDTYTQNEKLIRDVKSKYKRIINILKQK